MKIFGVGLSKTGTNSLVDACKILGFDLLHYPPPNLFEAFEECDGGTDLPTLIHFKELDQKFPGSKFVWTVRDRDTWLESARKHMRRRPSSTLNAWGRECRVKAYGSETPSDSELLQAYDAHMKEVGTYFQSRPQDCLILDIVEESDDSLWKQLCTFLGKDLVPEGTPFPHGNSAPMRSETVDAVYPYAAAGAKWQELRYSIRSLKNFLDLRHIFLVGDKPEEFSDVHWIPKERTYSDTDSVRNRDYTQSILWAALSPEVSDPFLCINDDHYLLCPMTAANIEERVMVRENMDNYSQADRQTADREWQFSLWRQYDRLKGLGLAGWNFECHTPVLVSKAKIIETWAYFGYGDGSLIWKSAYFNMFPPANDRAHLSEQSAMKAGFYEPTTAEEIRRRADAAVYLNHNDDGLNDALIEYIEQCFPEPSRYEG